MPISSLTQLIHGFFIDVGCACRGFVVVEPIMGACFNGPNLRCNDSFPKNNNWSIMLFAEASFNEGFIYNTHNIKQG